MGINSVPLLDLLDMTMMVEQAASEEKGEDSYCLLIEENAAIAAVFDGCGGLGSKVYESFQGHTGAYMASRLLSGAVSDWFNDGHVSLSGERQTMVDSLKKYIQKGFSVLSCYGVSGMKMRGSMVRDFPSTAAIAAAQMTPQGIVLHVIWAGDSRVYLWDASGLAQVTEDDIEGEDAFTNLRNDGTLTNVVSADGKYELHYRCVSIDHPMLVFAATDGCFGYLKSPMQFEYVLTEKLRSAQNPEAFQKEMHTAFEEVAGDDFAMAVMSFGFGEYENLRKQAEERRNDIFDCYISKMNNENMDDDEIDVLLEKMWENYRVDYERYLKTVGELR